MVDQNWVADLLAGVRTIKRRGVALLSRSAVNFGAGFDATDDPTNAVTTLSIRRDVRDAGADDTDSKDATSIINSVLAAAAVSCGTISVGPGTYRVDGTIVVPGGVTLYVDPAAVLHRHSGGATTPVVRLTGNQPKLTGDGLIWSETACPRGVVLVGPNALNTPETINRAKVEHVYIRGPQSPGDGSAGIWVDSSEPTSLGSGGNNYQGTIVAPTIQGVDEAIHFDQAANAWQVFGPQCAYIGRYMIRCHAATGAGTLKPSENAFHGGFVTQGGTMLSVIKLENADSQLFYGVHGEPGAGTYYQIDANCTACQVHGQNNAITAATDAGTNSIVTSGGASSALPTGTGFYLLANGNIILPKVALPQVSSSSGAAWMTIGVYGLTTKAVQLGQISGGAGGAVYLGDITPSGTNYSLFGDGTSTVVLNGPGASGTVALRINNVTIAHLVNASSGPGVSGLVVDGEFIWCSGTTPTTGNFALFGDGTTSTVLNAPTGGTCYMRANNVTVASFSAAQALLGAPVKLAGQTLATSATAGSNGDVPAQVNGYLEMVADFGSGPANIRIPFYNP